MSNPNLELLEWVAHALGPIRDDVVFVGGCAAGLLLTQARADRLRATEDVDIVTQALTRSDYQAMEARMRAQGFKHDVREAAPLCRWIRDTVTVDLMPANKEILGFANRWYPLAMQTSTRYPLPSGVVIDLIAAPVFIGTKFEAFLDRGRDADGALDYLGSHDLEDIIAVVDRRPELLEECRAANADLRAYLGAAFSNLLASADFTSTLAGHLPGDGASQARLPRLLNTLQEFRHL